MLESTSGSAVRKELWFMFIFIFIHINIYIYVCICIFMGVCTQKNTSVCIHTCISVEHFQQYGYLILSVEFNFFKCRKT